MVKKIKLFFKKIALKRTTVLMLFFVCLAGILIHKLYDLQIINGADYANRFSIQTTKERGIKSTRGNILDRNGKLLAYNVLSYSVTLEDNGSYSSTRSKNLNLNSEIYRLIQIIEANGDTINTDFHITLDEHNNYRYNVEGITLSRFKADVYGKQKIEDMTPQQAEATAEELMQGLVGSSLSNSFMIQPDGKPDTSLRPYSAEELAEAGLPAELTKEDILKIACIRYQLFTTSYQKYLPVTIATDVSEKTVAAVMESQATLQGVDVVEDSKRIYNDSIYFASIIGYTGKASTEELDELKDESDKYNSTSIIGKSGIEQQMETVLQGVDGKETVSVDNLGKVLDIDEDSRVAPVQGNDVYLTIDRNLQISTYHILEQRIAGILLSNLQNIKEFNVGDDTDTSFIPIAIYDAYFSLINNNIVDYRHFAAEDASEKEKKINGIFEEEQGQIFKKLDKQLGGEEQTPYKELSNEYKAYQSYIVNDMLSDTGILISEAVDKSDDMYKAWTTDEKVSLYEYLSYAVSQNWVDVSIIAENTDYLATDEILAALSAYVQDYLKSDSGFSKIIYKYLLLNDKVRPSELCMTLYDQGVLKEDKDTYNRLSSGDMSAYGFMREKITNLELTPAQLALDPCSGSAVITDPNTGEFLAVVSYPGYDNNRLANTMDADYYNQLLEDLSEPFYNKATQQKTAPGSTFKPITAVGALTEGILTEDTNIDCTGTFDKITGSPLRCWNRWGHGNLNMVEAIKESCNVFFCDAAYQMGTNSKGVFSEVQAMDMIQKYCKVFNLDKNSGIEISESDPQISNSMPIPSAIGQGTHNYTTSQLARYVSTLANSGVSYKMTILDKSTDSDGNLLEDYAAEVESILEVDQNVWDVVHDGMRQVIATKKYYDDLGVKVAGKTGTAQESKNRSPHGVFIGYAPFDDPQMAICVRVAHGYSSTNAAMIAKDVFNYYFKLKKEEEILTGKAAISDASNAQQD